MLLKCCNSLPSCKPSVASSCKPCVTSSCKPANSQQQTILDLLPVLTPKQSDPPAINTASKPKYNGDLKEGYYRRQLPESCISFCSAKGKEIFKEALVSGHMDCYFPLAAQFRTQEEPAFCGLSTLVMVLNTLEVDPKKVWKGPWRWYHENMLDCCIPLYVVEEKGVNMEQFSCLAACNMLKVRMTRVDKKASEHTFRQLIKSVTKRTDQVLVASYSRGALGQTGDGHFAPIGGYNAERDLVLMMDTARFKYPPHWVTLPTLFHAMGLIDESSGLSRGYFLLSKNQFNPGLLFRLSPFFSPLAMSSKLTFFLKAWEDLLFTDLVCTDVTGSEVAEMAVLEVVGLLGKLHPDVYLITTQLDDKFAEVISYKRYLNSINKLLSSLEGLPFFSVLSSRCKNAEQLKLNHAGSASVTDLNEECGLIRDVVGSLKPLHFLAAFMLSWPYRGCKPFSIGSNLHKYFLSQLNRPSCESLHNECARMTQQLHSLVGYNKKCQKSCCTSSTYL